MALPWRLSSPRGLPRAEMSRLCGSGAAAPRAMQSIKQAMVIFILRDAAVAGPSLLGQGVSYD